MRTFFTYLGFSLLVGLVLLCPDMAHAQTIRIDSSRTDSLFVSVKAGGTTFDSARVVWSYNGLASARVLTANQTDTIRLLRAASPVAKRDALALDYYTYPKAKSTTYSVASRVVIPPVVPPPVTSPVGTPAGYVAPALPLAWVPALPASTRRVDVPAGGDLQAALNAAQPGDEIVLANGAMFTGNYVLPSKTGTEWMVVRCESALPAGRVVVGSNNCATIATPNADPALRTANGASRWWLQGLQIEHAPADGRQNYGIVVLGRGDETTVVALPTDIVLDRVQVRGAASVSNSRCVAFNGARLAVFDSDLRECHAKGQDAQGVGGWNGPGPFLIENNHIEASGQGVMFGGADPRIKDLSPSDITIRRNYILKPLSWGNGRWTVKAAFELKHARRVLFEGNVIENHWADAQVGFAILLQTLADNNTSWAWTTVSDATIRNNVIRNSTSGVNMLARVAYNGGPMPSNPSSRIVVQNNLFENVGRDPIKGTSGIGLQWLQDHQDVAFIGNTFTCNCSMQKVISLDGKPTRAIIADNVFGTSSYQISGNGAALSSFPITWRRNVIPGLSANALPVGALGNATGANLAAIQAATAGVVR